MLASILEPSIGALFTGSGSRTACWTLAFKQGKANVGQRNLRHRMQENRERIWIPRYPTSVSACRRHALVHNLPRLGSKGANPLPAPILSMACAIFAASVVTTSKHIASKSRSFDRCGRSPAQAANCRRCRDAAECNHGDPPLPPPPKNWPLSSTRRATALAGAPTAKRQFFWMTQSPPAAFSPRHDLAAFSADANGPIRAR